MEANELTTPQTTKHDHSQKMKICEIQCPHAVLRKLAKLLYHPMAQNHNDRVLFLLYEYLRASEYGIWICDIPFVIDVLEIIVKKRIELELFDEAFSELLQLLAIPPLLERSSDILHYKADLEAYFSTLGQLFLYLPEDSLQLLLIKSISSIMERTSKSPICGASLVKCIEAIENSYLPETVVQFLVLASESVYESLLKLVLILARKSQIICKKMISQDAIGYLLMRLEPTWRERLMKQKPPDVPTKRSEICHYKNTSKVMWFLILASRGASEEYLESLHPLGDFPLWSLLYAFRVALLQHKKTAERNDLLAIMLEITYIYKPLDFLKTGIAQDLAQLAVATEIRPKNEWLSPIKLLRTDADYIFKKLLIFCLPRLLKLCPTPEILEEAEVLQGLINIMHNDRTFSWIKEQHCKLMWISLNVLKVLIPAMPRNFADIEGHVTILNMLDKYHIHPYKDEIFIAVCQLLKKCLRIEDFDFVALVNKHNGTIILLDLLEHLLTVKFTTPIQEALTYIFCALEILFQNKAKADPKIVELNILYLQRLLNLNMPNDSFIHTHLIMCQLDFLWESVIWNDENLKDFMKRGGVYLLLDIIEAENIAIKLVGFGCLTDLCELELSIPYIITWRGKIHKSVLALLLSAYREFSERIGVKTSPEGYILDSEYPLMSDLAKKLHTDIQPNSSPSVCYLLSSLRPKVYAIVQLLYYRHSSITNQIKQYYHMDECLSLQDKITLIIVQNFLALKLGEIWEENEIDLRLSGVEPIPVDKQIMSTIVERVKKWGLQIKKKQQELVLKESQMSEVDELKLYHKIKEPCLAVALDAMNEMKMIARCSERMFRLRRKIIQQKEINNYLVFDEIPLRKTYMCDLKVTPVFNQCISIQSNINVDTDTTSWLRPVSPEDDNLQIDIADFDDSLQISDDSESIACEQEHVKL